MRPDRTPRPARRAPDLRNAPGRPLRSSLIALIAPVVLVAGCDGEPSPPRELPFPAFEARALFPELGVPEEEATERQAVPGDRSNSAFQRALRGTAAARTANGPEPGGGPPARRVPLGANLLADLPADPDSWRWATERQSTLIVHAAGGGRPDALIYTEPFAEDFGRRPSADLRRFQITVNPDGNRSSSFVHALGRWIEETSAGEDGGSGAEGDVLAAALRQTATRGRGLGFTPREDDGATGLRWVGRNEGRVTLRFARYEGSWQDQRPLPDRLRSALEATMDGDEPRRPATATLGRVPAYMLVGTAQEPDGTFGAHIAILCTRNPECSVAEALADLLASVRTESPGLIRRLIQDSRSGLGELARTAGLEVLAPGDRSPEAPELRPGLGT